MKALYKGLFNWKGETNTLYRYGTTELNVFHLFINKLASKYQLNKSYIRNYFIGTDKYKITLKKEVKMHSNLRLRHGNKVEFYLSRKSGTKMTGKIDVDKHSNGMVWIRPDYNNHVTFCIDKKNITKILLLKT